MEFTLAARVALGLTLVTAFPATAIAQAWVPGSEIAGPPVRVTTAGVTNTVYFDQGGSARIMTPGGNTVNGTWTAINGHLCLSNGAAQECWPYAAPFQANQPLTLTSSCNATSTWLASAVNGPTPPPEAAGERGK
ncbi:hypothetical protein [Sphingomonas sp.]|uniref:hypothetical protein n=1 Tax=Sphingomonas sp. TaxID=28214 RepID=UPI0025F91482|nr:hypothetical protein [Sphingomonas sp.]MBV9527422.1 hypothetical protein [Sphingomonas sp.]